MFGRDRNKERTVVLRDGPRYLDAGGTGDAGKDGYSVRARRPRAEGFNEIVSLERADRIEEFEREFMSSADLMDSY